MVKIKLGTFDPHPLLPIGQLGGSSMLTQKILKEKLFYCPATGDFFSKRSGHKVYGYIKDGYRAIEISGKDYRSGRLAFLYMTSRWPSPTVDHKDCDPLNDRWRNLREANFTQQTHNRKVTSKNQCGVKGIRCRNGRWQARIRTPNGPVCLGTFDTLQEAHLAYQTAACHIYGTYARF